MLFHTNEVTRDIYPLQHTPFPYPYTTPYMPSIVEINDELISHLSKELCRFCFFVFQRLEMSFLQCIFHFLEQIEGIEQDQVKTDDV